MNLSYELNIKSLDAFRMRYGDAHVVFACHAALPLSLTPDLLYSLWANFQVDSRGKHLGIPWTATADLLLSGLCEEVGDGLYEMSQQLRINLLDCLERDEHFGPDVILKLAAFLYTYVQPSLNSEDLDLRDFAQTQSWVSMAYLCPKRAAQGLAVTLSNTLQIQPNDLLRVASIVRALNRPLANYPDLLTYARGMAKYAQGDIKDAQKEFDRIKNFKNLRELTAERLFLPRIFETKSKSRDNYLRMEMLIEPLKITPLELNRGFLSLIVEESISLFAIAALIYFFVMIVL